MQNRSQNIFNENPNEAEKLLGDNINKDNINSSNLTTKQGMTEESKTDGALKLVQPGTVKENKPLH